MILLRLDRKSSIPIYQQIVDEIIHLVESGKLHFGMHLPSSRQLANKYGVNRSTVCHAYLVLQTLGYVDSRPGSYTTVRKRKPVITIQHQREKGKINWEARATDASNWLYHYFQGFKPEYPEDGESGIINLSQLDLDPRLFPTEDFRRCMNQVVINQGARIFQYGDYRGYAPLREYIANRMQLHRIMSAPEEILVTNGAQQALELILKLFAITGREIFVESPTYANILPLLKFHRLKIIPIPMAEEGMNLDCLQSRLKNTKPLFLYTIPNFQNPTGITATQKNREELLALCEHHHLPIVEDGFEEEMKYFGKVVLPIKSMDRNQIVIYLGTFSKVLFPGIRIGWIAAEKECIDRLTALKRFSDITTNAFVQVVLHTFCRQGYYDLHIKRMHRIFRKRMQIALQAMEQYMPAVISWTKPDGGYTIWVKLNRPYPNKLYLKEILLKHRVLVSPGDYYFPDSSPNKYFRISIANLNEEEIEEGIKRLGEAMGEFAQESKED